MGAAMANLRDGSIAPTATPRRGFRLLDAMILVAAMAMAGGVMRSVCDGRNGSIEGWWAQLINQEPLDNWSADIEKILVLSLLTMPVIPMVALALIPVRLAGPRPRFRRLTRQPGLIAACASGVAIAMIGLPIVVGALAAGASWDEFSEMLSSEDEVWSATMYGGLAVLVSWMTLFVGGRWRAEPSWVDRLGRAMGLCWILAAIAVWAAWFLIDAYSQPFRIRLVAPSPAADLGQTTLHLATLIMPMVAMVALALIPIRLVSPRPRFRHLARQPGLIASCASGLAIALLGLQVVIMVLVACAVEGDAAVTWQEITAWLLGEETVTLVTRSGGLAVLVSWMTLLLGRQWRAEPKWTDRLGRALGVCWILAAFAVTIGNVLIQTDYLRDARGRPVRCLSFVLDAVK
jgi:hypothetical protein